MDDKQQALARASRAALVSGLLLALLCALTALSGTSQQSFERFAPPEAYAAALLAQATPLCWIIGIDDVFIVSYLASTTLLCLALSSGPRLGLVLALVLGATWVAGGLDLLENHHILSLLRRAQSGFLPTLEELDLRVVASSFKWLLGHAAFALLAFALPARTGSERAASRARETLTSGIQLSLWAVQLPIGVATLVVSSAPWLTPLSWLRYGCLLSGFLGLALLLRPEAERTWRVSAGSGAPA